MNADPSLLKYSTGLFGCLISGMSSRLGAPVRHQEAFQSRSGDVLFSPFLLLSHHCYEFHVRPRLGVNRLLRRGTNRGSEQTAARYPRWAAYIASFAGEKSDHERFCEKKIAATQKAKWAKDRASKPATASATFAAKKKRISPAARAKLSAKLKAYWAAKKKTGKKYPGDFGLLPIPRRK